MGTRFGIAAAAMLLLGGFAVFPTMDQAAAGPTVPQGKDAAASLPPALDVYLVETATREVCDTFNFGGGDVRTECRTEPIPARADNPALRGICITRYGKRSCY
ncbi:MAG: hypothetical protein AAF405_02655 [Pseudomonadota bacterium]